MKDGIIIFTDGASRGNPGRGGWAAIIVEPDKDQLRVESEKLKVTELGGSTANTTNNQMELKASIEALKYLNYPQHPTPYTFSIFTDSSYLINGITKWLSGWRLNGWKTKAKEEVLNRELWEELADLSENKNIEWKYLGGHSGIAGNERCDEIATKYADSKKVELYKGPIEKYKEKYGINILNFNFDEEKVKAKASSRRHFKAPAYSYVSLVDGNIKIHKTWAECEARVKGKKGARFKKSISKNDEQETIKDWNS